MREVTGTTTAVMSATTDNVIGHVEKVELGDARIAFYGRAYLAGGDLNKSFDSEEGARTAVLTWHETYKVASKLASSGPAIYTRGQYLCDKFSGMPTQAVGSLWNPPG